MINLAHNMYEHFLKVRSSIKSQARKANAYLSFRSKFYRNFAEAYFRLLHDAESFTVLLRGDQFVFQSINVLDVIMRPSTNETVDVLMEKVCESIYQRKSYPAPAFDEDNGLLFLPCYQIQFTSLSVYNLNEIGSKKCNFRPILGTHIAVQYRSREGNMPLIVQSSLVPQRPILLHCKERKL